MKVLPALLSFAMVGQWVTTPAGDRVCQLTTPIARGMTLQSGFCKNWQPPFEPVSRGQTFPFYQGWIRSTAPFPGTGYIQIHVEDEGWVP